MISLNFGTIPADLEIDKEGYPMEFGSAGGDWDALVAAINQGIDSHLEAVVFERSGNRVTITDSASMRTLLRRLSEDGGEDGESLASSIASTLGYEWI